MNRQVSTETCRFSFINAYQDKPIEAPLAERHSIQGGLRLTYEKAGGKLCANVEYSFPPVLWYGKLIIFPEDTGDFFVIIETVYHHGERNKNHGDEGCLPDAGAGGGTGAVRAGAQQQ